MEKKVFTWLYNAILFKIVSVGASIAKFSFIMGSSYAFFSLSCMITPLSGHLCGIGGSIALCTLSLLVHAIFKGILSVHFLAYHIPGLCAALYWSSSSKVWRIVLAVGCMILFVTHPVGAGAALYSLFWLIPLSVALQAKPTRFMRALGSTFTAHAVGSVIWLYTLGMSPDKWLMLIPVVIVERLLLATGIAGFSVLLDAGVTYSLTLRHKVLAIISKNARREAAVDPEISANKS